MTWLQLKRDRLDHSYHDIVLDCCAVHTTRAQGLKVCQKVVLDVVV